MFVCLAVRPSTVCHTRYPRLNGWLGTTPQNNGSLDKEGNTRVNTGQSGLNPFCQVTHVSSFRQPNFGILPVTIECVKQTPSVDSENLTNNPRYWKRCEIRI